MSEPIDVADAAALTLGWLMDPAGGLDQDDELVSACAIALGTDRLANPDDTLPDDRDDDRRGWWADLDAEDIWDGWPIGTRLWLLAREKITTAAARQGATIARVEEYVAEALQPFVDRGIASRIEVVAARDGLEAIGVEATLYRGPLPAIRLRFADLWSLIRE